ncbi:MAG: hypothetical protein EXR72_14210 [Myxococcales bacterium]|nr:hypothetical protein [Myxococcales bacterium]
MGRPVKADLVLARARASSVAGPLDDPRLATLAGRFQEVQVQMVRLAVEAAAECGQILLEGRAVAKRHYQQWVREVLQIDPGTASNYVAVAHLARDAPAFLERHRELGLAKIYKLARVAPDARNQLLKRHDIAGWTTGSSTMLSPRTWCASAR